MRHLTKTIDIRKSILKHSKSLYDTINREGFADWASVPQNPDFKKIQKELSNFYKEYKKASGRSTPPGKPQKCALMPP